MIGYHRRSLATKEINSSLEILYWAPHHESEEVIDAMRKTYNLIHTYKDTDFYGEPYQPADEVLTFSQQKGKQ